MSDWEDSSLNCKSIGDVISAYSDQSNERSKQTETNKIKEEKVKKLVQMDAHNEENFSHKAQLSYLNKILRETIVESKADLEIIRNNPTSPLYSVKSFEDLRIPNLVLKGIYAMGFQKPSRIQETILPLLMASPHHNTIAQSQSGTGKTAAFLISSLKRVDASANYPQVLILSPTLELAMQTADVARKMCKFAGITVRHVTKGEMRPRGELVEHVLVGTPGKFVDWLFRFKSFDIKRIKVFVLDEADIMIDLQGHREQSMKIQQDLDKNCQLLLFSATYDENVLQFAECIITDPIIITLKREEECLTNVKQFYCNCKDEQEKYSACADIYGNVAIGSTFIFLHTRESAKFLKNKLERDGHQVGLLTGDLTTEERLQVIKRFREGDERVLITTNVSARGIDVDQVSLVVNYDLPFDVFKKEVDFEAYLHRIGRCGRFGKTGFAINLINAEKPRELDQIRKLEKHFSCEIKLLKPQDADQFKEWQD